MRLLVLKYKDLQIEKKKTNNLKIRMSKDCRILTGQEIQMTIKLKQTNQKKTLTLSVDKGK